MTRHTTSTAPTRDAAEGAGRVHAADPRAAAPSATTAAPALPTTKPYVEWTEEDWAPYEARVRAELEEQGIDFEPSPEQVERTLRLLRSPIGRVSSTIDPLNTPLLEQVP